MKSIKQVLEGKDVRRVLLDAYENQWEVASDFNPNKKYTVSKTSKGDFQCSCLGWTRHVPRKDCKHIRKIRAEIGE